jgi:hypothetical protein
MMDDRGAAVVSTGCKTKREYRKPRLTKLGALHDVTLSVGQRFRWDPGFGKWRTGI